MGAACCVAARDRTIQHGSSHEFLHGNIRHSPSWSFRWDSRVGVAGEENSVSWLSDGISRNDALELKSMTDISAHVSDGGSSMENQRTAMWRKSPVSEKAAQSLNPSGSGHSISRNISMGLKEYPESPLTSAAASAKLSPSVHSTPSALTSPLSSQAHLLPPPPIPSRWAHCQVSGSLSSEKNSPSRYSISDDRLAPYGILAGSNESSMRSHGRSSDGWSAYAFSELMSASQRERWSFESESCISTRDKTSRFNHRKSRSTSVDIQTCGVCSRSVTERCPWSTQKIIAGNELSVVAVLICGHVYHAECLENITPEINKYDPACPVCTLGGKQAGKLSGKVMKAEKELKSRSNKKSKNRVVDTGSSFDLDYWSGGPAGREPKLSSSSSLKSTSGKPFLKRHFSFGSRSNKSTLESHRIRKKGFFWPKSSRE